MLTGRVEPVTRPVSRRPFMVGCRRRPPPPARVSGVCSVRLDDYRMECTPVYGEPHNFAAGSARHRSHASLSLSSRRDRRVLEKRRPALPSLALYSLIPGRRLSGGVLRGASSQHRLGARPCWFNTLTTGSQRFRTSPSRRRDANTGARAGRPSYRARQCRARTGRARASSTPS